MPTPAEIAAKHGWLAGELVYLITAGRVHLRKPGSSKTLCGRYVRGTESTEAALSCGTCRKAAYAPTKAKLDKEYGKVQTAARWQPRGSRVAELEREMERR